MIFHKIYYVDASARIPQKDPTMKIPFNQQEMIRIDNNGTLAALEKEVERKVIDYFMWLNSGDYY